MSERETDPKARRVEIHGLTSDDSARRKLTGGRAPRKGLAATENRVILEGTIPGSKGSVRARPKTRVVAVSVGAAKKAKPRKAKKKALTETIHGEVVTDAQVEKWAAEAEAGYDVEVLLKRRGRPPVGEGPGTVVPVRLDAPTLAALDRLQAAQGLANRSEAIRAAIRAATA